MTARPDISIRELGAADIDILLAWRMEVLHDVFAEDEPWSDEEMLEANRAYYERALGVAHRALIASVDGQDAGCGAICLQEEMPSPDNPSGKCAYLMNIYTRPSARHMGVADTVVRELIDIAKAEGAGKIYLEATDAGAPLYEEIGFAPIAGMMKLQDESDRK